AGPCWGGRAAWSSWAPPAGAVTAPRCPLTEAGGGRPPRSAPTEGRRDERRPSPPFAAAAGRWYGRLGPAGARHEDSVQFWHNLRELPHRVAPRARRNGRGLSRP